MFPEYYKEWVRFVGGIKNVFLRELIKDKEEMCLLIKDFLIFEEYDVVFDYIQDFYFEKVEDYFNKFSSLSAEEIATDIGHMVDPAIRILIAKKLSSINYNFNLDLASKKIVGGGDCEEI